MTSRFHIHLNLIHLTRISLYREILSFPHLAFTLTVPKGTETDRKEFAIFSNKVVISLFLKFIYEGSASLPALVVNIGLWFGRQLHSGRAEPAGQSG